ncbi:MAG: hypothetical protein A2079_06275 [Geobacteraceae bacterium GWC2_48_7]|nr:MAG: hypothetical protein A2079_06275 [Geobacteraceae bacterium GWC2_48_7]
MRRIKFEAKGIMFAATVAALFFLTVKADASPLADKEPADREEVLLLKELVSPPQQLEELEKLVAKSSLKNAGHGFATYYAARFIGRKTASGPSYDPDKMTAAHQTLPFGTVVRVVNPANNLDVHVTINDRCAPKPYQLIDLSRAAAKKIGLWGKGRIKVVIIPLTDSSKKKA